MTLILAFSCFHFSFKVNSWPTKAHRSRWTFDGKSRKSYVNLQRFDDLVKLPNMTRRFKYANFMHTARKGGRGRVNGLSFTGQSPRVRKWCIIRNGIFRSFYFWIILNDLNQIIPLIPPLSFMHVTLLLTWLFNTESASQGLKNSPFFRKRPKTLNPEMVGKKNKKYLRIRRLVLNPNVQLHFWVCKKKYAKKIVFCRAFSKFAVF